MIAEEDMIQQIDALSRSGPLTWVHVLMAGYDYSGYIYADPRFHIDSVSFLRLFVPTWPPTLVMLPVEDIAAIVSATYAEVMVWVNNPKMRAQLMPSLE